MRITNRITTTKYIRSLNNINTDLNKYHNQVVTGRKYMKVSEDPAAAVKAYRIRRDMASIDIYSTSVMHAKNNLSSAETSLNHIQDLVKDVKDQVLYAMNGTQSIDERKIAAEELKNLQKEMLQTLNSQAADAYYFAGSKVGEAPFTLDTDGKLCYQGQKLDNLTATQYEELKSDAQFADIGLGIRLDASGNVDRNSVFEYTISGVAITGYGTSTVNGNTVSNNIYDIIGELVKELEKPDGSYTYENANALYGHLQENESSVLHCITEVGTKASYLNFMGERYDDREIDALEMQQNTEGMDREKSIIYFEMQKLTYQAAMQMGTQVIPMSIFNYIS